jgi:hypothetical protein
VAPNTKVTLAGLGTLWLHRRIETAQQITVIMVQLVVTVAGNPRGSKWAPRSTWPTLKPA